MDVTGSIKVITELDKLCRTCLLEKNNEELRSIFENTLDLPLRDITSIKACI